MGLRLRSVLADYGWLVTPWWTIEPEMALLWSGCGRYAAGMSARMRL